MFEVRLYRCVKPDQWSYEKLIMTRTQYFDRLKKVSALKALKQISFIDYMNNRHSGEHKVCSIDLLRVVSEELTTRGNYTKYEEVENHQYIYNEEIFSIMEGKQ